MMDPITLRLAMALGLGLLKVVDNLLDEEIVPDLVAHAGKKVLEWTLLKPVLDRAVEELKRRGHLRGKEARALQDAVKTALAEVGAPTDDEDKLVDWFHNVGLDRLAAKKNDALRRQVARAVLAFNDPKAEPPEDLMLALGWPRSRGRVLAELLRALRAQIYGLEEWRPLIEYADAGAELGVLRASVAYLARMDEAYIDSEAGKTLRVYVVEQGLSKKQASVIERGYRADVVGELSTHYFKGIAQFKRDIRLPLDEIYMELGLLSFSGEEERRQVRERLLMMNEGERAEVEEQRLRERVSDALAKSQKLVILGEPGAGKTTSLRYIALMLAHGHCAARLGLDVPYIPLLMRLSLYARALEKNEALSLDNYLLEYMETAYASHPGLKEYLRWALNKGACMILLDGLDEVSDDPAGGQLLRTQVVEKVQTFSTRWCKPGRCNRLVVTSRTEGYWAEPLHGFDHVELSRLIPPDEVQEFLVRWYTAYERSYDESLPYDVAETKAEETVAELLPQVMASPGVQRLATNPLLLTILALIYENVGKLPDRRVKLYDTCAETMIESWRQFQTGRGSKFMAELGDETFKSLIGSLAYWLHETHPGGTASHEEWRQRILYALMEEEEYEQEDAEKIAGGFMDSARKEVGLLAERGSGQYGFFHLTFEEYLAACEMARSRTNERRRMLSDHWEDPRWREVILLAAGQIGIVETRKGDVSDFIADMLELEPQDLANVGRGAVLAGRALVDMGPRGVTKETRRRVLGALRETMQDLGPGGGTPNEPPVIPVRTRYEAGEVLDELGWLPDDLNAWVRCPGTADGGGDLLVMKYPVTNAQFERFVEAGGYENSEFWGGKKGRGWQWRVKGERSYSSEGTGEPEYWHHPRYGRERCGYPVVGVSWYESAAYATWLTDVLERARAGDETLLAENLALVADLVAEGAKDVRLPREKEWEAVAGGVKKKGRYPWDPQKGRATREEAAILARANTGESGISGTTPVAMYPLGISEPFKLMDLAGNVWEWTETEEGGDRVLRGGSWYYSRVSARCADRSMPHPRYSDHNFGFRLVSPICSDF